jgi:hypothetical protein
LYVIFQGNDSSDSDDSSSSSSDDDDDDDNDDEEEAGDDSKKRKEKSASREVSKEKSAEVGISSIFVCCFIVCSAFLIVLAYFVI